MPFRIQTLYSLDIEEGNLKVGTPPPELTDSPTVLLQFDDKNGKRATVLLTDEEVGSLVEMLNKAHADLRVRVAPTPPPHPIPRMDSQGNVVPEKVQKRPRWREGG